ncbi:ABC transporter ATP-binding protein [Bacillus sonorensis]|uniref:ABC transporter ATP-binding protein YtlC n=2 Tax=Bacillus sonorensis TaxID=119858 RepID=M5PGA9_9BACI|nr:MULTISPECIES: ABC transporter ATP-binding protein [Bacillus]TWK74111.1 Aliphatic sulfonates import ATP-binding protein SsuB [Bacillus paralicheniformis]ASB87808.1 Oligopeptide transport ATP-binding protein AppD [Bacillus sonorensis]EME76660.1 ABC transporter ATP-binding protein YtlC [Bacillus sonorensis L12]MBG9915722.1 spermidine/putrescine ABC transporter ATP-binding protein [Bacillus sonorensis]MCF7617144.1 ABC transporter ATP-binding protein [Bacillus sonorensis]
MSFLQVQDITHTYFSLKEKTAALENISFEAEKGEFVSFLGPSGCGKTTLLSIIAGIISPTAGRVLIDSRTPDEKDLHIGYMLQQDYLFPWKTIEENVLIGLQISKKLTPESKKSALDLLAKLGLYQVETKYPKELSGGMRQRASLARTLAVDPDILLLDEPFSALDYQTKLNLEDLVFNTLKTYQKTAVLVTHDIGEAIAMSDRILLFSKQPGTIHKTFTVPESLKGMTPFDARQEPEFQVLFQTIWKELNHLEQHQTKS